MPTPRSRPIACLRARGAVVALLVTGALVAGCGARDPARLLEEARASLAAGDEAGAEIHLKNLLQQRPDDGEARVLLAGVHASRRDFAAAESEWRRALELGVPPDRTLPGLLQALAAAGDAKAVLAMAARHPTTQPEAKASVLYWSGRAHLQLGQARQADEAFRAALETQPGHPPSRVQRAARSAAAGDLERAAAEVDAVLAGAPAFPEALLLKAQLQVARADTHGARESLTRAIEAAPRRVDARARLVSLLIDANEDAAAAAALAGLKRLAPKHPATLHLQATLDLRANRLDAAAAATDEVLAAAPGHAPAMALAATVALRQHRLEIAERHIRQIARLEPHSSRTARLLIGLHLERHEPETALRVARTALERDATDATLLGVAGEAALRAGEFGEASRLFAKAAALAPRDATARMRLGLAQLSAGEAEAGFAQLEAAVTLDPQSIHADLALIAARLRARQFDAALAAVDRLATKLPGAPLPHHLRGTTLLAKADAARARASFERALQADPGFLPAASDLALLDLRERRPQDARQRLESVVAATPGNVRARLALADVVTRTGGSGADVARLLEQARAADPAAIEPVLALAAHHVRAGQPRQALPMLQQALARHPGEPSLLEALGTTLLAAGERQRALHAFEERVRRNPRSVPMLMRLGEVQAGGGDTEAAIASFRQAGGIEPRNPAPQVAIAALRAREGRTAEARRIARTLQTALPRDPAGAALEGDLDAAGGRWADAARAYRRALALRRTTALAIQHHRMLLKDGQTASAQTALHEALEAAPDDLALRAYAAERAIATRRWAEAVTLYDRLVRDSPDDVLALNNLAWALMALGDRRALQVAEAAHARAPDAPAVIDTLAVVLLRGGDPARAATLLERATSLAPRQADYRLHYAEALAARGDAAGARRVADALVREFPDSPEARAARAIAAGS